MQQLHQDMGHKLLTLWKQGEPFGKQEIVPDRLEKDGTNMTIHKQLLIT